MNESRYMSARDDICSSPLEAVPKMKSQLSLKDLLAGTPSCSTALKSDLRRSGSLELMNEVVEINAKAAAKRKRALTKLPETVVMPIPKLVVNFVHDGSTASLNLTASPQTSIGEQSDSSDFRHSGRGSSFQLVVDDPFKTTSDLGIVVVPFHMFCLLFSKPCNYHPR